MYRWFIRRASKEMYFAATVMWSWCRAPKAKAAPKEKAAAKRKAGEVRMSMLSMISRLQSVAIWHEGCLRLLGNRHHACDFGSHARTRL